MYNTNVKESQLNDEQRRQIKELEDEWMEKVKMIPPINLPPGQLSHAANKPYRDLEIEYTEKIKAVIEKYV